MQSSKVEIFVLTLCASGFPQCTKLSALDPELTGEVLKTIQQLADENMTMAIVTHEMAFAKSVSDKVLFMVDGKVEEEGTSTQIFENPQSERTRSFLQSILR